MATNRKPRVRQHRKQLNQAAIAAWKACDYSALHRALNLAPWERSPLPLHICGLGVDERERPDLEDTPFDKSFDKALNLQRELIAAVGMPDRTAMRRELEKDLAKEVEYVRYLKDEIANPSGMSWGGSYSYEEQLVDSQDKIVWLKELLGDLEEAAR